MMSTLTFLFKLLYIRPVLYPDDAADPPSDPALRSISLVKTGGRDFSKSNVDEAAWFRNSKISHQVRLHFDSGLTS